MKLRLPGRPGAGFVTLLVSSAVAFSFFTWAGATPRLDAVWELLVGLETGTDERLTKRQRALLQETLADYPELADSLLGGRGAGLISANDQGLAESGCAYVIRARPERVALEISGPPMSAGAQVSLRTQSSRVELSLADGTARRWQPPDVGPFPQLIEIVATRADGTRAPLVVAVSAAP